MQPSQTCTWSGVYIARRTMKMLRHHLPRQQQVGSWPCMLVSPTCLLAWTVQVFTCLLGAGSSQLYSTSGGHNVCGLQAAVTPCSVMLCAPAAGVATACEGLMACDTCPCVFHRSCYKKANRVTHHTVRVLETAAQPCVAQQPL